MTQTRWVLAMLMAVTACAVWAAAAAPANAAFRAPATNYDPDNHTQNQYFAGPDGSLREMSWAQSRGWWRSPAVILPGGSVGSAPATNYDPDNHTQNIFFEGPDGSLREASWASSSGWHRMSVILPAGSLGSAPATNYDPDNHTQNVYFAGPDGSLREMSWAQSRGWWHSPAVILPGGSLQAAPSPPSAPAPAAPAGQGSVAVTPAPAPVHRRSRLHVRIVIKWRYTRSHTRLVRIQMGRLPRRAVFSISCRGRGCPARKVSATRATLQRRHRTLRGPMYRAGDRLMLQLSAPSYAPERVRIVIRNRRAPAIDLL